MKELTDTQFKNIVAKLPTMSNKQLALLNFEVWQQARERGGKLAEKEIENGNR